MNENYNEDSWTKGQKFENFIEKNIFSQSHYDLLNKTHNYSQNSQRYVNSSLEPDFQFRSKLTGKSFRVEAKFRTKPFNNAYEILSENQFKIFPDINSADCPIYIAFGFGGGAANPEYLSLIPFNAVNSRTLSPEEVFSYRIDKELYPPHNLEEKNEQQEKAENKNQETTEEKEHTEPNILNLAQKKIYPKILVGALIGVIIILFSFYDFSFSKADPTPEESLKSIVENYYQLMNSNKIEKLPEFLSQDVRSWYGTTNMPLEQIMKDAKTHRGKYPFSDSNIDWDSFKVVHQENGEYFVTYRMIYKTKQKITDDYQIFNLNLLTYWDENFRLKSIREIKL